MKLALKIFGVLVAVFVLLLVAANLLLSADRLRNRVAERIREQTGQELKVAGSSTLLFLPNPHIVLTDATLTGSPEAPSRVEVKVPRLEIDLSLFDLISRRIDARRVVFFKPLIRLHATPIPSDNRASLGHSGHVLPVSFGAPAKSASSDAGSAVHLIEADATAAIRVHRHRSRRDIRLKDVRIVDGTVQMLRPNGSVRRAVREINAAISLPHITDPLHAKGSFDIGRQPIAFGLTLTSPGALRDERPADLRLNLRSALFKAGFQGRIFPGRQWQARGRFTGTTQSLQRLITWRKAPAGGDISPVEASLAGTLGWRPKIASFENVALTIGDAKGQGRLTLDLSGKTPHLLAAIALADLDLTPFLPHELKAKAAGRGESRAARAESQTTMAQPGTSSQPPGAPQAAPSRSARSVSPFDADININVAHTKVAALQIGPSTVALKLRNDVLTAKLDSTTLYGGTGTGSLVIDAAGPVPAFAGDLDLEHVAARPLLSAAGRFQLLSGPANVTLHVEGAGRDAAAIKSSLRGKGQVALSDGTIDGINLTRIIKQVGAGRIPRLHDGGSTDFSTLGGSFTLQNGIAHTNDIEMVSPLLEVKAAGNVDIPHATLDILAHPKIIAGPEGKGGANDLAGLSIPVRIQGPLADPSYHPEIADLFANPQETNDTIHRIGKAISKRFKGKPLGEAIGRFLGSVEVDRGGRHGNRSQESGQSGQ